MKYKEVYYKYNINHTRYMEIIDLCHRLPHYSVLIILADEKIKDVLYKLKNSIIDDIAYKIIDGIGTIKFKNGSMIRIINFIPAFFNFSIRGYKYNYCLVNHNYLVNHSYYQFNKYFINNVLSLMVDYKGGV